MKLKSEIGKSFEKFLLSLEETKSRYYHKDISFQIYYDLFKIRQAQWNYKLKVNRKIDYSLSDIFQDIIAHYLRHSLPKTYSVILECKQGKIRPDILIKKNGKNWSIIEIKTTIGWDRGLVTEDNYMKRLNILHEEFKVPIKRIFYIFESASNVNKKFKELFQNNKRDKIKNFIFPLFLDNGDPYYVARAEKIDGYKHYSDAEIQELFKKTKLTDFKNIIKKVKR